MGLTEERIQRTLTDFERDEFTDAERAALRYAVQVTEDESKVSDETYEELRRYFDEGEIVELGVFVALCNGFDKLISTWGLSPDVCAVPYTA